MEPVRRYRRSFAYDDWANRETLAALRALRTPVPDAGRLLAHVVASERLWWDRIRTGTSEEVVWPELELAEIGERLDDLYARWSETIAALDPRELARRVSYANTKGEPFTSTVEDVLEHVLLHASYHRGQIAVRLRDAGVSPPYTDAIHCTRTGRIE